MPHLLRRGKDSGAGFGVRDGRPCAGGRPGGRQAAGAVTDVGCEKRSSGLAEFFERRHDLPEQPDAEHNKEQQ